MNQKNILFLFGGKSMEHEVSVTSARNVISALDKHLYTPVIVGLSKESGTWYHFQGTDISENMTCVSDNPIYLNADKVNLKKYNNCAVLVNDKGTACLNVDFVFPLIHGKYGEDGCLQGLCRMFDLPFAGSSVGASAIAMDKDFSKRILSTLNIPMSKYMVFGKDNIPDYEDIIRKLGNPIFLKPANSGSSVGVYKLKSQEDFKTYLPMAFAYDEKIIVEESIPGREIECAVLGNHNPIVSILGEIKPNHEFYSYEAKYLDPKGADLNIPAVLNASVSEKIQEYAIKAYTGLGCKGFARIDFFVTPSNKIYFNEVNTLPGFTNISMYPKLFEASGIGYSELISRIIQLGFESFSDWNRLATEPVFK